MVSCPAIVSDTHGYAFIFTHRLYLLLEGLAFYLQCTAVIDKLCVLSSFLSIYLVLLSRWNDQG